MWREGANNKMVGTDADCKWMARVGRLIFISHVQIVYLHLYPVLAEQAARLRTCG
jgi:hypothetical protein